MIKKRKKVEENEWSCIPYRLLIDNILIFLEYSMSGLPEDGRIVGLPKPIEADCIKLYGVFKKDKFRNIFLIWKSCRFEYYCISGIDRNIRNLFLSFCWCINIVFSGFRKLILNDLVLGLIDDKVINNKKLLYKHSCKNRFKDIDYLIIESCSHLVGNGDNLMGIRHLIVSNCANFTGLDNIDK
jgi:hypothetical protein